MTKVLSTRAAPPGAALADLESKLLLLPLGQKHELSSWQSAWQSLWQGQFNESGIGNAYAKTVLHETLFMNRFMDIVGRLRFDIAPGSIVQVDMPGEKFAGIGDKLFGAVYNVRIGISTSAGNSQASTQFGVRYMRTEKEHAELTIPNHPLYNQAFTGSSLLEGLS